ncbi:MAG: 3-oxoadipate enol-lactonase [Pseudomonadota bacterium]
MNEGTIVTGDACQIAYRLDGPEHAPILLLSNSLGTTLQMWDPQMEAFTRNYRVLRYDSRGHGKSDAPAGSYSLDRLGRDVIELIDALGFGLVDFCGLSLGGMTGQWLGVHAPQRIGRLVLANTSAYMGPPAGWDARIDLVREKGMAPLADASVARWFTDDFAASGAAASVVAMLMETNPTGYIGCCAAIRDMDMRRTSTLIGLPTLVIGGSLDPSTPLSHSEDLVRAIADSKLGVLAAAHLSSFELPQAFNAMVLGFLHEHFEERNPLHAITS